MFLNTSLEQSFKFGILFCVLNPIVGIASIFPTVEYGPIYYYGYALLFLIYVVSYIQFINGFILIGKKLQLPNFIAVTKGILVMGVISIIMLLFEAAFNQSSAVLIAFEASLLFLILFSFIFGAMLFKQEIRERVGFISTIVGGLNILLAFSIGFLLILTIFSLNLLNLITFSPILFYVVIGISVFIALLYLLITPIIETMMIKSALKKLKD